MKIFTHLNRKANMQKNLDEIINMTETRIKDQKDILVEWKNNFEKWLKTTELNENNERDFYIELCDKMQNRDNMLKKIDSWINSLYLLKEMKCQKQKRNSKKD